MHNAVQIFVDPPHEILSVIIKWQLLSSPFRGTIYKTVAGGSKPLPESVDENLKLC